jgi:LysR family transcriptional regulator, flagellar master operon regulator
MSLSSPQKSLIVDMDISFLKTFLEVSRRRHFGKAAEALYLTQSAVSARIKLLESSLGVELFTRTRNDIQLTPAGQRLQKHARTIVDGWEQARQSIALDEEFSRSLVVGSLGDIWSMQLLEWTTRLRTSQPDLALQLESYSHDTLLQRLESGLIDLAFLFDPPLNPGFVIRETETHELLLVSDQSDSTTEAALQHNHVMVDWGSTFALILADQLPNAPAPSLRVNQGRLALELITRQGGSAWLPLAMVHEALDAGQLYRVDDAPHMERIVYAAYRPDAQREETIRLALSVPWQTEA